MVYYLFIIWYLFTTKSGSNGRTEEQKHIPNIENSKITDIRSKLSITALNIKVINIPYKR